eukprot:45161-Rhodomonas_salina.1
MSNRVKRAATEYHMNLGQEEALSIADLQCKHGVQNHTSLTLMIDKMKEQADAFALASKYADSKAVRQAVEPETTTQTELPADTSAHYCNYGVPFEVFSETMVYASTLCLEKK